MKPALVFFVVIVIASTMISCRDQGAPVQVKVPVGLPPYQSPRYVPGRVVIGFVDSVNYRFIESFIGGHQLTPINISADSAFNVWIQVDSGSVSDQLVRLRQDSGLDWIDQRNYNGGDPQKAYLLARFLGTATVAYARALIQSIPGLSWKETIISPRIALVRVEIGREQSWIDLLKPFPFIKYAELDYILTVAD